ncbi:MAG: hypothetical protein JWQ34_347 [Mucilaginibacter sp.]|uniref:hypothetical protein n=1 Tax=Mucilaginibacter sp. TaxID=1882438 RepID=UPI00260AA5A3|nr:hypothetical protein [Mucilaginibacter sp.]MDB5002122.1 hypothetical protein [Mucilaginibacter sp.]
MKYKEEYFALVIVGNWNLAIFTNEWVSKYLFDGETVTVEYPTNSSGASPRFSYKNIRVSVFGNRLQFSVLDSTDSSFNLIEDLALKISQYLEHTPVSDLGINFVFESKTCDELSNLFPLKDIEAYNELNFEEAQCSLIRKFKKDDYELNIQIIKNTNSYTLDINNTYKIVSLLQFKEIFTSGIIVKFKNDSLELLNKLYNIELENE